MIKEIIIDGLKYLDMGDGRVIPIIDANGDHEKAEVLQ